MRVLPGLLFASVAFASLPDAASSAVLIPVPAAPDSTATTVFGINDNNVIAGSFVGAKDGIEHSFFGSLDGNYTTFDAGTGGSEARDINNSGYITGFSNSQSGITAEQPIFERKPNGRILNVTMNGQQLYGRAQGINNSENKFAGTYWDVGNHEAVAFVGKKGAYRHDVKISMVHQASNGEGINSDGAVVGSFFQPPTHGFIVSGRTLTVVDYPGANVDGTSLEGINDSGNVVGQWVDTEGNTHSFLLDPVSNTFTDIDVPGATQIAAWNINSAGAVAVSTDVGSFVWCARRRQCPAGGTTVAGQSRIAKPFPRFRCDGGACRIPEAAVSR